MLQKTAFVLVEFSFNPCYLMIAHAKAILTKPKSTFTQDKVKMKDIV